MIFFILRSRNILLDEVRRNEMLPLIYHMSKIRLLNQLNEVANQTALSIFIILLFLSMVMLVQLLRGLLIVSEPLLIAYASASTVRVLRGLQSLGKTQSQLNSCVESLKADSYIVWPNFFEVRQDLTDLCKDLDERFESGEMREAAVKGPKRSSGLVTYNGPQQRTVIEAIRKTSTCWLEYVHPKTEIEEKLLLYLDVFRMQLGESLSCNFNFEDTECQYARYSIGGYYRRHSDSHRPSGKLALLHFILCMDSIS